MLVLKLDEKMTAGSRKKKRTRKERARSMRKSLKLDEKMTAHVGSKANKEEQKKMKTKETTEVDKPRWVLPSRMEGYDGPTFSEVLTRFKEDPSGKRKKEVVVRLTEGLLEYMVKHPYPPPCQPLPFMDPLALASQEMFIAMEKANHEGIDKILQQYKDYGYAEMLLSVTDVEE